MAQGALLKPNTNTMKKTLIVYVRGDKVDQWQVNSLSDVPVVGDTYVHNYSDYLIYKRRTIPNKMDRESWTYEIYCT